MSADSFDGAAEEVAFRLATTRTVHSWAWWNLIEGQFVAPDGERFERTWVRSPGAVGVVAFDHTDRVVLVHQFRPALGCHMWEIPAGLRDVAGEAPDDTARREMQEEVGLRAGRLEYLGRITSAPGISDSDVILYRATDLTEAGEARHGPEERHMTVHRMPMADALRMVDDGRITDSKTVAGLLLAARTR